MREETDLCLGIVGGSGIYDLAGLKDAAWRRVSTPWGDPSDEILTGAIGGLRLAFLPRHGRGHVHSPSSVPYRANLAALKSIGVTDVLAVSACGSFREDMAPGHFVLIDQFIDRTVAREPSFFGRGLAAHVSMADPVCKRLGGAVAEAAARAGATLHSGGTYLAMEGPQFSTKAESRLFRDVWGADIIGMTSMPEARLAREAELCYAGLAMITDYDSWHPGHGSVDITAILATLAANGRTAQRIVEVLPDCLPRRRGPCPCGCDRALTHAVMTAPDRRDPALAEKLQVIAGRVLT
jgi:5'-methylthioadenosine phosphorylase